MNMIRKNSKITPYLIISALLLLILAGCASSNAQKNDVKNNVEEKTLAERLLADSNSKSSGSTDEGDAQIELTPSYNNGQLEVEIAINTHSVDLSQFDLKEITTLEYNGKVAKPVSAPALGGHHVNGKLVFKVDEDPDDFTIKIVG